ncbi:GRIP and coiled-coil domain containing 88 kDa [Lycorma delicatula]|uniref:GRIP and coiled-coil domain containing 88 kDa n=1 Tax=Lycorma delicatula TaxID=130591 RepID=UPI003F50F108
MEKVTKKQMQEIIKKQDEELSRYKKRFQDLVAAHKGLLKEKKTLETSLKVMSRAPANAITGKISHETESKSTAEKLPDEEAVEKDGCLAGSSSVENSYSIYASAFNSSSSSIGDCNDESVDQLKSQLATLMQSISTLSEEKSRMEAGFQADKKSLRCEKEELENTIKDLQRQLNQVNRSHQSEVENYKSKLIIERHQREKEHHDHGVMIRELQKLLAEERSSREKAEGRAEEMHRELFILRSSVENKENELMNQLENLKLKLNREKDTSGPMLLSLQEEMSAMKQRHLAEIQREKERALEAEERAKTLAVMHEKRVANLEARLAELSETIGTYDRRRQEDLQAIFRLKERLIQLEVEQGDEKMKGDKEMDVLVEELKHLKSLIETANNTSDKPLDIYSILLDENESVGLNYATSDHALCNEEYQLLKDEFEAYKKQVQSTQRSYSPKIDQSSEVEPLKLQVKNLKENIRVLKNQLEATEESQKEKLEEHQKSIKNERIHWQEKLAACEQDHRGRIADLELQLNKQRERALALVNEKDEEITALKTSFHSLLPSTISRLSQSSDKDTEPINSNCVGLDVVESRPMLHYVQELARLQVDIKKLRKQNHLLETALRDSQLSAAEEKEYLNLKINKLTEEVARLERCQTREGANLEYLKNVVLSYLLTSDENKKSHMLNAISAVLQFSDSEKIKVSHSTHHKVHSIH